MSSISAVSGNAPAGPRAWVATAKRLEPSDSNTELSEILGMRMPFPQTSIECVSASRMRDKIRATQAMTSFLRAALLAALSATCCPAQTATVTFYSANISIKSEAKAFLPKSQQPFGGLQGDWLYDGQQRLARIRVGRYVTFRLGAGAHSFTDDGPPEPSQKPLIIDVKDGGQYCVRLFARMINLGVISQWKNQIEEVPCQQAAKEAAHLKPIEIKRVEPAFRAQYDPATTFPCSHQPQH